MRRHLASLALAGTAALLAAASVVAAPAGAQACTGDLVTASMSSTTASGPAWSVTDACVDARDYFTGDVEGHAFAIGISTVTYDDGHVGRLAFLSVRIDAAQVVTVIGMEDPGSARLRFAGTVRQAAIGTTGASASGAGIGFPPLEATDVVLDFTDVAAPWPDWAVPPTTTVPGDPSAPTTTVAAPADGSTGTTTTTVPAVTPSTSVATLPSIPGVDLSTTTVPAGQ